MPADLNMVTLIGRLTRDPEARDTPGGDRVARLRLAVASRARDESGEWTDRPNFFDVTVFGRLAEAVIAHTGKGSRVAIAGRLAWREWNAQDGSRRQGVEIVASEVQFLSFREDTGDPHGVTSSDLPTEESPRPAQPAEPARSVPTDDDIPF